MRRRKRGDGGSSEELGRPEGEIRSYEGLAVTVVRGALDEVDEVPLFRRRASLAYCDMTEGVELRCQHIQGSIDPVARTTVFPKEPIPRNFK